MKLNLKRTGLYAGLTPGQEPQPAPSYQGKDGGKRQLTGERCAVAAQPFAS